MTMEILDRPHHIQERNGPAFWVDEAIWGHRLHDEQSPWLIVLEFLNVLLAENNAGRLLSENGFNTLSYKPQIQLRLRNLVFNNPYIVTTLAQKTGDETAWNDWLVCMNETAGGLTKPDFSYLRQNFDSFKDFASVINFLQKSAIEGTSNKRWSSKFVFPFGPHALYEDLNIKQNGTLTNDRRFFARTGEILYLMLCRSRQVDKLRTLLDEHFIQASSPYDSMAHALQGETQYANSEHGGAFLPCSSHPVFDKIAEDWISILSCPVPTYDKIPHLVTMTGLNLLLYLLYRAQEVLGVDRVRLICEIVSPRKTVIRDLSGDSYQHNNLLPQQAIRHFINQITHTPAWVTAMAAPDPRLSVADLLHKTFDWAEDNEEDHITSPHRLVLQLEERAIVRHRQHVGKIHAAWSRAIGLSSRRSSRRTRYAPNDRLLKTLVVCCVKKRMEFREFLAYLHMRYGLVIGDAQAHDIIAKGDADQEDFSNNAQRLEDRLASLGLLKRLSDSCAYVENPFQRDQDA